MNVIKPFLVRSIVSLLVTIPLALFVRSYAGASTLLTDINGVGWLVGVLGTIYTCVAAFTVVEVWSQFNGVTALIAKEAKAVTSIWNYVDYLNHTRPYGLGVTRIQASLALFLPSPGFLYSV